VGVGEGEKRGGEGQGGEGLRGEGRGRSRRGAVLIWRVARLWRGHIWRAGFRRAPALLEGPSCAAVSATPRCRRPTPSAAAAAPRRPGAARRPRGVHRFRHRRPHQRGHVARPRGAAAVHHHPGLPHHGARPSQGGAPARLSCCLPCARTHRAQPAHARATRHVHVQTRVWCPRRSSTERSPARRLFGTVPMLGVSAHPSCPPAPPDPHAPPNSNPAPLL
jgi:hypothetical protein